jgi:hypothetical protein
MFTRAELEYKLKVRNAQLALRVVVFSIGMIVPAWIAAYVAQRLGFEREVESVIRPVGFALIFVYLVGVTRILLMPLKERDVVCPKCDYTLGLSLGKVLQTSECPRCKEKIVGA